MTFFYQERDEAIVAFEESPQGNPNAAARVWTPYYEDDQWRDVPSSSAIAVDVAWSGDYYPIAEEDVPMVQARQRAAAARRR